MVHLLPLMLLLGFQLVLPQLLLQVLRVPPWFQLVPRHLLLQMVHLLHPELLRLELLRLFLQVPQFLHPELLRLELPQEFLQHHPGHLHLYLLQAQIPLLDQQVAPLLLLHQQHPLWVLQVLPQQPRVRE